MKTRLLWSAWRNGTGTAVGLKVPVEDRRAFFDRSWATVFLVFPEDTNYGEIEVNVAKPSFWNDKCHELINKRIKEWLSGLGLLPWPRGRPPKVIIEPLSQRRFAIRGIQKRSFDEVCAPLVAAVAASGVGDDEFDRFFEEVRDEVWRDKQSKKP
jgi:hypothetical protein